MDEVIRCQAERLKSHSTNEEKLKDMHIVFIEFPCTSSFLCPPFLRETTGSIIMATQHNKNKALNGRGFSGYRVTQDQSGHY